MHLHFRKSNCTLRNVLYDWNSDPRITVLYYPFVPPLNGAPCQKLRGTGTRWNLPSRETWTLPRNRAFTSPPAVRSNLESQINIRAGLYDKCGQSSERPIWLDAVVADACRTTRGTACQALLSLQERRLFKANHHSVDQLTRPVASPSFLKLCTSV